MSPRERIMSISFIEKTKNKKKFLNEIGVVVKNNCKAKSNNKTNK